MSITLRQLGYLTALARHRHFGRAAEECAVSQPALSVQIQALEAVLGTTLVERGRGHVELTPAGIEVVGRAGRILLEVNDLIEQARHGREILTGQLRVGAIPTLAPYLLPTALPYLQRHHPELELQIRETQTAALTDELLRGVLDVLILSLPIAHPEIETVVLFADRFLVALPASHALAAAAEIAPARLTGERLLLLEEGHCLRDQALDYCQQGEPRAVSGFGASSLSTIVQMVANGLGITLLPELARSIGEHDPRLVLRPLTPPQPCRQIGLAWRRSSPRKPDFMALARLLLASRALPADQLVGVVTAPSSGSRPPQTSPA